MLKRVPLMLMVLIILLSGASVHVVAAQSNLFLQADESDTTPACSNLDIVFVIDQSGSMSGSEGLHTDPENYRILASRWAIEWMINSSLNYCPGAFHRFAVVSFGNDAHVDVPLRDIRPQDVDEAKTLINEIRERIIPQTISGTNPAPALELAAAILHGGEQVTSDAPRKRVIIFITDGNPSTDVDPVEEANRIHDLVSGANGVTNFDPELAEYDECINLLRDQYASEGIPSELSNQCRAEFYGDLEGQARVDAEREAYRNSTYIYPFVINNDPNQNIAQGVFDAYRQMASSRGGELFEINSTNDIALSFGLILSQLADVPLRTISCGAFAMNPYLRTATLSVFKLGEESQIYISSPSNNGVMVSTETAEAMADEHEGSLEDTLDYTSQGALEVFTFKYPEPGIWSIDADDCDSVRFLFQPTEINMQNYSLPFDYVRQYDQPPYYDTKSPVIVTYTMFDQNPAQSQPVLILEASEDQFAVETVTTVTTPSGEAVQYPMAWDENRQLYLSQPILVPSAGIYELTITGHTNSSSETEIPGGTNPFTERVQLFSEEGLQFEVGTVTPFTLTLVSPEAGEILKPAHASVLTDGLSFNAMPIEFRIRLSGRAGSDLGVNAASLVFVDPSNAIDAQLYPPNFEQGEPAIPVDFEPDPENPLEFIARVEGIGDPGDYRLIYTPVGVTSPDFRPELSTPTEIIFSRKDVCLSSPGCVRLIELGLIGMAFATGVVIVWLNTGAARGQLIFESAGVEVARVRLNKRGRFQRVGGKDLKPALNVGAIVIQRADSLKGKKRGGPKQVRLGNISGPAGGQSAVIITGRCKKGRPFRQRLDPNVRTKFACAPLDVRYEPFGSSNSSMPI